MNKYNDKLPVYEPNKLANWDNNSLISDKNLVYYKILLHFSIFTAF